MENENSNVVKTRDPLSTGRPFDSDELMKQIGQMNIWAISGGRWNVIRDNNGDTIAVEMHVSKGYLVRVWLGWDDTWTVARQYINEVGDGIVKDKGTMAGVYFDQVGEVCYQASCYVNVEFPNRLNGGV